jgi:hypothetical protein
MPRSPEINPTNHNDDALDALEKSPPGAVLTTFGEYEDGAQVTIQTRKNYGEDSYDTRSQYRDGPITAVDGIGINEVRKLIED